MNKTTLSLITIGLGFALASCGVTDAFDQASRIRPNDTEKDSFGDIVDMVITIGGILDDPEGANNRDLYKAVTFRHFVGISASRCVDGDPMLAASMGAGPINDLGESCVISDGRDDGHIVMQDCVVHTPGDAVCLFNLDATKTEISEGGMVVRNDYAGFIGLSGPMNCPTLDLDIAFSMDGPSDSPTVLNGECFFEEDDGDMNIFSGSIGFDGARMVDGCDKLSAGSMSIGVMGRYWGEMISSSVKLNFHEDPCGDLSIDREEGAMTCAAAAVEVPR